MRLLERLKVSKHVDQIFISDGLNSFLEKEIEGLVESIPIDFLKDHWQNNNKLIFVGSIGAVVRLVSPLLALKKMIQRYSLWIQRLKMLLLF